MERERALVRELLQREAELQRAVVVDIIPLAGDMSSRRYFRVMLSSAPVASVLLVLLAGAPGPVGGGPRGLSQDDTYVEVGAFLKGSGVRVPELLADGRGLGALLLEDVGSVSLLEVAQYQGPLTSLLPDAQLGEDALTTLFSKALLLQRSLMGLKADSSVVVFQRRVTAAQRALHMREFLEHYALPRGFSARQSQLLETFMDHVSERIALHPLQVSHFDFMASNLHVLPNGELCLIDFQDMCLDSPARDVVSLLNDRGMDEALGPRRHRNLLSFYLGSVNSAPSFLPMYDEYLLLWDFRVAGRFALLAEKKGVARYSAWIPGTLRRLGRTLYRVTDTMPMAGDVLKELSEFSPDVCDGSCDTTWRRVD